MNTRAFLGRVVTAGLVAGVVVLAWMPSPPLKHANMTWLPEWVRHGVAFWAQEDFLCNVAAYFVLAGVMQGVITGANGARRWWCVGGLAGLVVVLECGQLFLPQRFFDLRDIAAGWLGVAAGSLVGGLAAYGASRWRGRVKAGGGKTG